jgi:hypothetical protein
VGQCADSGQCCSTTCPAVNACSSTTSYYSSASCDVTGTCTTSTMPCAGGYKCDTTGTQQCRTSCASDSDCQSGYFCGCNATSCSTGGGVCKMQLSTGTACNPATDCYMGASCNECSNGNHQCTGPKC